MLFPRNDANERLRKQIISSCEEAIIEAKKPNADPVVVLRRWQEQIAEIRKWWKSESLKT